MDSIFFSLPIARFLAIRCFVKKMFIYICLSMLGSEWHSDVLLTSRNYVLYFMRTFFFVTAVTFHSAFKITPTRSEKKGEMKIHTERIERAPSLGTWNNNR